MNELALFAGGGGGLLGGLLLGWRTVCAVEIDAYARSVLLARQRDGIFQPFPIWDDIKTFNGKPWRGRVDVVSGGFPCQDISVAGKRAGINGSRSGLWKEFARVICEVRPQYVWVENSPALTIRGLGRVLGDLAEMGFDARWGVLGACHVGADHRRNRIWICANADGLRLQGRQQQRKKIRREGTEEQFQGLVRFFLQRAVSSGSRGRISDVVAHRMDRLKTIGNGQVPAVVRLAWETLNG